MKQIFLLLFIIYSTAVTAQNNCPETLVCKDDLTISIDSKIELNIQDVLENFEAFESCDNSKIIFSMSLFDNDGQYLQSNENEISLDCQIPNGAYTLTVDMINLNNGATNDPLISCFAILEINDQIFVCPENSAGSDIQFVMDCIDEDQLSVAGASIIAEPEDMICIPFTAKNFDEVLSMQFGVVWDPNVINFVDFNSDVLPPQGLGTNEADADAGVLRLSWVTMDGAGLTFNDGEELFEICFDVVGDLGDFTKIELAGIDRLIVEFSQNESSPEIVEACLNPALVEVGMDNSMEGDFEVTINDQTISSNGTNLFRITNDLLQVGSNEIKFNVTAFDNYLENISTLDLVIGLKMFVLDEPINPLSAIALDVDYSGGINVRDLVLIRQLILGIRNDLNHPGYFFLKDDQKFDATFDVFDYGYFDSFTFDTRTFDGGAFSFSAHKYGDLSIQEFHNDQTEVRSSEENILFENKYLVANSPTTVKFTIDGNDDFAINGFQSSLNLDGITIKEVKHNYGASEFMSHMTLDEQLNLLYASLESQEEIEFELVVVSEESGFAADKISLNNQYKDELVKADLSTTKLSLEALTVVSKEFRIVPNPFNISTTLSIPTEYLGGDLIISNVLGNKIHTSRITDESITLVRSIFNSSGIYLITLEAENHTMTRRILLQE